jgi:hypothetical protein
MSKISRLERIIAEQPGLTELELAKALHGPMGYAQLINPLCRTLLRRGLAVRLGRGYSEPFRYYPVEAVDPDMPLPRIEKI